MRWLRDHEIEKAKGSIEDEEDDGNGKNRQSEDENGAGVCYDARTDGQHDNDSHADLCDGNWRQYRNYPGDGEDCKGK